MSVRPAGPAVTSHGRHPGNDRLIVRPLGYVEDGPVVRQIGDRDVYLGNEHAARPAAHDRSFAFVLSATEDARPLTTHHRPLVDGPEVEWQTFAEAVETARDLYRQDGSLLVHCKAGISRSTTVIATTLAMEEGLEFREALATVQDVRPVATPHPALHKMGVTYLAAQGRGRQG